MVSGIQLLRISDVLAGPILATQSTGSPTMEGRRESGLPDVAESLWVKLENPSPPACGVKCIRYSVVRVRGTARRVLFDDVPVDIALGLRDLAGGDAA